jgi:CRP-like cAMP-binding protein
VTTLFRRHCDNAPPTSPSTRLAEDAGRGAPRSSEPPEAVRRCRYDHAMAPSGSFNFSGVWLFSECSSAELKAIQKSAVPVSVRAGTTIFEEGEVGRAFYCIMNGTAHVVRNGRKAAELGPSGYFGELALLDKLPRSATVRAATDMDLLEIDQRHFNRLINDSPSLTKKLLIATAARLRNADAKALGRAVN